MAIELIDTSKFVVSLKATIQSSGRLNFTSDTARIMQLNEQTYARFARDSDNPFVLYLVLMKEQDEFTFKVTKSGAYYYLPTKSFFESLGKNFDFHLSGSIMFDLLRVEKLDELLNGEVYKMTKRMKS